MTALALKPTRRQILDAVIKAVNAQQNVKRAELQAKRAEVLNRVDKRREAWERLAIEKAGADPRLIALRKAAKRLGLTEHTHYHDQSKTVSVRFTVSHDVKIADLGMPPYPVQTREESELASDIYREESAVRYVDDEDIVTHLLQDDADLQSEIEAVAGKIVASVQQASVKVQS
jgi:hypothetical protein